MDSNGSYIPPKNAIPYPVELNPDKQKLLDDFIEKLEAKVFEVFGIDGSKKPELIAIIPVSEIVSIMFKAKTNM